MGWVWPCGWFCRGEFGGVQCFRHSYLKTYTYIKTTCCLDRRAHIVFPPNLRLKPDWTGVLEIKWRNAQIHSHISHSQKRTSMGHHVVYGSGGNHLYRMAGNTVYSHDVSSRSGETCCIYSHTRFLRSINVNYYCNNKFKVANDFIPVMYVEAHKYGYTGWAKNCTPNPWP